MEIMNINEIIKNRQRLEAELKLALSTMEKSDKIQKIRREIKENQQNCPHFSQEFNWTSPDGKCPYCGKSHI